MNVIDLGGFAFASLHSDRASVGVAFEDGGAYFAPCRVVSLVRHSAHEFIVGSWNAVTSFVICWVTARLMYSLLVMPRSSAIRLILWRVSSSMRIVTVGYLFITCVPC